MRKSDADIQYFPIVNCGVKTKTWKAIREGNPKHVFGLGKTKDRARTDLEETERFVRILAKTK